METIQWMATEKRNYERKLDEKKTESDQKYNEEVRKIDDDQEAAIQALQNNYKLWAVVVPPIPLLVVASIVFFNRRAKEREGVSSKRCADRARWDRDQEQRNPDAGLPFPKPQFAF